MKNKKKLISSAILIASSCISTQAYADLADGSILSIDAGVLGGFYGNVIVSGSFFAMDTDGSGSFQKSERTGISGNNGVILGTAQAASGTHSGAPDGSASTDIDNAWNFFGNTGAHQTTSATNVLSAAGNSATIDFSGWSVAWNGIADIPMSAGTSNGVAMVACAVDCADGDTYTLDYFATVPLGDPSGFGGVFYTVHLEGTVSFTNTLPTAGAVSISSLPAATHSWTPDVSDVDGQDLTCTVDTAAINAGATASVSTDCSSGIYTPNGGAGFSGSDIFSYTVSDGIAFSSPANVTVNISADPAPICPNFSSAAASGVASPIPLNISNCTDSGGTAIITTTVAVASPSANGATVTVDTATQIATFTSTAGASGTDTFTYTVMDGNSASQPATISVTVSGISGTPPTVVNGTLTCGDTAIAAGETSCTISAAQVGVVDNGSTAEQGVSQTCIGGCFDFEISGISVGSEAQMVLALSTAIPAPAEGNSIVYRKLNSTGWVTFDPSGNNAIHSLVGTPSGNDIVCPPADDPGYALSTGLRTGNRCVRLTITDGGPNDMDGVADGTVKDPGGIAETFRIDTRVAGTDGCSMTGASSQASAHADWWILSAFVGLLGWLSFKRKQA